MLFLETFRFKKNVQNLNFTKSQKPKATILKLMQNIQLFHFPSLYCYPIFLITKTKYIWVYDYSFCCWDACRNIQVQEKKVCISLKFIILKIKDPWLILINCQTCHFNFLSSGPSFFFLSDPSPIIVYPCHWLTP